MKKGQPAWLQFLLSAKHFSFTRDACQKGNSAGCSIFSLQVVAGCLWLLGWRWSLKVHVSLLEVANHNHTYTSTSSSSAAAASASAIRQKPKHLFNQVTAHLNPQIISNFSNLKTTKHQQALAANISSFSELCLATCCKGSIKQFLNTIWEAIT